MIELVADHLWQSTLVAAAAGLLALALRRNRAQIRYLVWLAASIKFVVPFAALAALTPSFDWRAYADLNRPAIPAALDIVSQPFTQVWIAAAPPSEVVTESSSLLPAALVLMWLVGVIVLLAQWAIESARIAALVRGAPVDIGCVVALVRRVERELRLPSRVGVVAPDTPIEPGVYGWLRPILIWPSALTDRLSDAQIHTIIVHELTHVSRRDNLTATFYRAVAVVCWFHPVIWMIGRRLDIERERACDEAVLAHGGEPLVYAESILETCRVCLMAPASVAGITGPELRKRIEQITKSDAPAAMAAGRKALIGATAIVTMVLPVAVMQGPVQGTQTADATNAGAGQTFEVASIKPKGSGAGDVLMQIRPGGTMNVRNVSVRLLIRNAYTLQDYQLVGGPRWMGTDRFDITAKAAGNPSQSQLQAMLRALLAERFQLAVRTEQRELEVYALVSAPSGGARRLSPARPCFRAANNLPPQTVPPGETPCGFRLSPGHITGRGVTMGALASSLASQTGRMVVDRTNRKEDFDLELEWTPFQTPASLDPAAASDRPVDSGPSIFTAIQEQLGLRLQSDRAAVDVLVVERLEQPTPD
jgi:bla regulator protein blaR1